MFKRLKNNIMRTMLLSSILFTTIIGLLSYVFLSQSLIENYERSALDSIQQKIVHSTFLIENVKNSSRQLSENNFFIEGLKSPTYNHQIPPMLNTLKNNSFGVLAATVYTDDYLYSTFNVSSVPNYELMKTYLPIDIFLTSDEISLLSIRTSHIALFYNNVPYDSLYGMISYIVKLIDDDGHLAGLMVVDISPNYLYNTFFNYDNHPNLRGIETYIVGDDGQYLKSSVNSEEIYPSLIIASEVPHQKHLARSQALMVVEPYLTDDYILISMVPLAPLYRTLMQVAFILLGIVVILNLIAYLIARRMTKEIIYPLITLKTKMDHTEIPLKT